jgi:hypothetical protein
MEPGDFELDEHEVYQKIEHYGHPYYVKIVTTNFEETKERARGWLGSPEEVKEHLKKKKKPGRPKKEDKSDKKDKD